MITVVGTYQNGYVKFERDIHTTKPLKVVITFLDDIEVSGEGVLHLSDFSFAKGRKLLKDYQGSFSDEVIDERRKAI